MAESSQRFNEHGKHVANGSGLAPRSTLPQKSFVSIEYPAVLTEQPFPDDSRDEHPSLMKALKSLSPLPVGYTSADAALNHLGSLIGQGKHREVECKLYLATEPDVDPMEQRAHPNTTHHIFRHAVIGNMVDTHNIVCRIRKRRWRRRKADGSIAERKEYTVEALGVAHHTVRFRTLPDYVYDPGNMVDPEHFDDLDVAPSLALHDSLRQMDTEGIRSFRFTEESETYEMHLEDRGEVSNLRMPPPPVFDTTNTPHTYGFRQNYSSVLRPYGPPDAEGKQAVRYVNRQRYRELAPIQFSVLLPSAKKRAVPAQASEVVQSHAGENPLLLHKLHQLVAERPMWSRRALFNQFRGVERRIIQNQRYLVSSVCYTITDGCWRDNLVRLGYDPRMDRQSRFYQRIAFQRQTKSKEQSKVRAKQTVDEDGDDDHESESLNQDAQTSTAANIDDRSHIFDGVSTRLTSGNYLLCDVEDEYVRILIEAQGPDVIGKTVDKTSGWYTTGHYTKIRSLLELRINTLRQTGKPASYEACLPLLEGFV